MKVGVDRGIEMMVTYFCGAQPSCTNSTSQVEGKTTKRYSLNIIQEALQRAKRVAETDYSVVGIVEEFNVTLAVMEAYLPGGHHKSSPSARIC